MKRRVVAKTNAQVVRELQQMGILPQSESAGNYPSIGPDGTWTLLDSQKVTAAKKAIISKCLAAKRPDLANAVAGFSSDTDSFFDLMSEGSPYQEAAQLVKLTSRGASATKAKLAAVEKALKASSIPGAKEALKIISNMKSGQYKGEFKHFDGGKVGGPRSSQVGEFFSLLNQALTYNDAGASAASKVIKSAKRPNHFHSKSSVSAGTMKTIILAKNKATASGKFVFEPGKLYDVDGDELVFAGGGKVKVLFDPKQMNLPGFKGKYKGKHDKVQKSDFIFYDHTDDVEKFDHDFIADGLSSGAIDGPITTSDMYRWLDDDTMEEEAIRQETYMILDDDSAEPQGEEQEFIIPYWAVDSFPLDVRDLNSYIDDFESYGWTDWNFKHFGYGWPDYSGKYLIGSLGSDGEVEMQLDGDWVYGLVGGKRLQALLKKYNPDVDWLYSGTHDFVHWPVNWTVAWSLDEKIDGALQELKASDPEKYEKLYEEAGHWNVSSRDYNTFQDIMNEAAGAPDEGMEGEGYEESAFAAARKRRLKKVRASLDDVLDDFVEMAAESAEIENIRDAHATERSEKEAAKYEQALKKELISYLKKRPLTGEEYADEDLNDQVDALMDEGEADYNVLMTLMGHGVGIWDGRWDEFFANPKTEIAAIEKHLKNRLSKFADDTGGGSLPMAFEEDAFETAAPDQYEEGYASITAQQKREMIATLIAAKRPNMANAIAREVTAAPGYKRTLGVGKFDFEGQDAGVKIVSSPPDIVANVYYPLEHIGKRGKEVECVSYRLFAPSKKTHSNVTSKVKKALRANKGAAAQKIMSAIRAAFVNAEKSSIKTAGGTQAKFFEGMRQKLKGVDPNIPDHSGSPAYASQHGKDVGVHFQKPTITIYSRQDAKAAHKEGAYHYLTVPWRFASKVNDLSASLTKLKGLAAVQEALSEKKVKFAEQRYMNPILANAVARHKKGVNAGTFRHPFVVKASERPSPDDMFIQEVSPMRGGYELISEGKSLGTFDDMDEAVQEAVDYMESQQFWPNLWFIGERGDENLITVKMRGGRVADYTWSSTKVKAMTAEARELLLYAQNDRDVYRHVQAVEKNLEKKWQKGTYDASKAWKIWMYPLETAAKKYVKEFGTADQPWHKIFSKKDREEAAKQWAEEWQNEAAIQLGPMVD